MSHTDDDRLLKLLSALGHLVEARSGGTEGTDDHIRRLAHALGGELRRCGVPEEGRVSAIETHLGAALEGCDCETLRAHLRREALRGYDEATA